MACTAAALDTPQLKVDWLPGSPMRVMGELDIATAPALSAVIDKAIVWTIGWKYPLQLDMGGVSFIDASALRVLATAQSKYGNTDGAPVLQIIRASPIVERVLGIVQMEYLLAS
jgi:anti-anti-sigma factor